PSPPSRSCLAHPQRKRSRVPKRRRFRHSAPRLSSISDAWGRLNVVTPFHHLSGDSHLHRSLGAGPITASRLDLVEHACLALAAQPVKFAPHLLAGARSKPRRLRPIAPRQRRGKTFLIPRERSAPSATCAGPITNQQQHR